MEEKDTILNGWATFENEPENEDREIITKLLETIKDQISDDSIMSEIKDVIIKRVTKVNDQKLWGLNLEYEDGNNNLNPCVYIQGSIDNIKDSENPDNKYKSEARKIIDTIEACGKDQPSGAKKITDIITFDDLDSFKDNINIRLVSRKLNQEFLEDSPYILFGPDLCGIFYVSCLNETGDNILSVKVTNDLMIKFGINLSMLMQIAIDNFLKKEEPIILPIGNVLADMLGGEDNLDDEMKEALGEDSEMNQLVVLSNSENCYGAACIMFRDTLKRTSKTLNNSNLVILPSSVHEVIAMPTEETNIEGLVSSGDADNFATMIQEINASSLAPADVLHDQCFFYNASQEVLYDRHGLRIPFLD